MGIFYLFIFSFCSIEIACTFCGASCCKCRCIALDRWLNRWIWISKTAHEIVSRWNSTRSLWCVPARHNWHLAKLPEAALCSRIARWISKLLSNDNYSSSCLSPRFFTHLFIYLKYFPSASLQCIIESAILTNKFMFWLLQSLWSYFFRIQKSGNCNGPVSK